MNKPSRANSEGESADVERDEPLPTQRPGVGRLAPLRAAILSVLWLTVLTGIVFPLVLAALVWPLFPQQAGGSLVVGDGFVGSELIGQDFTGAGYFHSRPSAAGRGYDAAASGGTNLGPANPKLCDGLKDDPATPDVDETFAGVRDLAQAYRASNGLAPGAIIPVDAVTRSGSGLDPHISPANADLQVARVARVRGLSEESVRQLLTAHTHGRQFGILGQPRVAVLPLNLALDKARTSAPADSSLWQTSPGLAGMRWLEFAVFLGMVIVLARPVGLYVARVFEGAPTPIDRLLRPIERATYRLLGIRPHEEMTAGAYLICFFAFSAIGTIVLFAFLTVQQWLPGGPDGRYLTTPMTTDLVANTALSFSTTTTWQAYGGETTLRYLIQVVGLASQNFLAAAAGLAVGVAFIRGFARERSAALGNFWVDLVRGLLWILLPVSLVGSFVLVWQGVPFNAAPYVVAKTLEGREQIIAQGPVAALELIKNLGTNGGGFFNANGAHPYENPTPLTNFIALLAISVLPASFPITFGVMVGRPRAGWALLAVMVMLFVAGLAVCDLAEQSVPPQLGGLGVFGENMEGKEVRFGAGGSVLAAVVTSNGATGSYNAMHDSFRPLGVLVPLVNMLLGEVTFGGLGTGLYSIVMVALVGIFMGGLMIGRTPEYLGKTIRAPEAKLIAWYTLLTPMVVSVLTACAVATDAGRAGLVTNGGSRGFTEVLFAYASCMANNGQTMAGLNANSPFYNLTTSIAMAAGRFGLAAFALTLAGRFAAQTHKPATIGSMPCDTPTFGVLVLGSVLLVGALCFLPALVLGPIAEYLQP